MCVFGRKLPLTLAEGVNRILKMYLQQKLDGSVSVSLGVIPRMSAVRSESGSNGAQLVAGNSPILSITGRLQRLTRLVDDDSVFGKYRAKVMSSDIP